MLSCILLIGGTVLAGCTPNADDYRKKPYDVTDEERVKYAEGMLKTTIDPEQDWELTSEYSVTITADAHLSAISKVVVLDGNPFAGTSCVMASAAAMNDAKITLSFRAPTDSLMYAACINSNGKCIARPFLPGKEQQVSFVTVPGSYGDSQSAPRRISEPDRIDIDYPTYKTFSIKDFTNFRKALFEILPDGQNNTDKVTSDFGSKVRVRYNDFNFYDLPLAFLGGIGKPNFESDNDNVGYQWTPNDHSGGESFLFKDHFKNAFQPKYDGSTKTYSVEGMYLVALDADRKPITQFAPNDVVYFQMYVGDQPIDEYSGQRIKVFQLNGELFIACEDGDDWDFNDRLFWFPYGTANLEVADEHFDPIPSVPQTWTYAWEDRDFGDYDLNDCVIQVQENAKDNSLLDITLVALGATRQLWLGFENKNAKSYEDYLHVFEQELHEVLGISVNQMANTGSNTLTVDPVTVTLPKPTGFDFQKCSFILGAKVEPELQGVYESDYYAISIAKKGQDPHGIVIPGKWQWPVERTCIIDAYPTFATWAHDITNPTAKNWYMYPVKGKVVKN